MDPNTILSKTDKGREEVETRKHKLEQRLRAVLITVNGRLTAGEVVRQFSQTNDVNAQLDKLLREGFVRESDNESVRLNQLRTELVAQIATGLGPAGDDIAMKIEAARTLDELRTFLHSRRALLDGALGKDKAAAFWAKVAAL